MITTGRLTIPKPKRPKSTYRKCVNKISNSSKKWKRSEMKFWRKSSKWEVKQFRSSENNSKAIKNKCNKKSLRKFRNSNTMTKIEKRQSHKVLSSWSKEECLCSGKSKKILRKRLRFPLYNKKSANWPN